MADELKKILIAEDDKAISNALKLKLESTGYQVDQAFNGTEAVEKIKQGGYALILLDLIMPDMNGFAVLEDLKNSGNQIPVMVLSNLGQEEDKKKALELGAKEYFVKSDITLSSVVENIQEVLK